MFWNIIRIGTTKTSGGREVQIVKETTEKANCFAHVPWSGAHVSDGGYDGGDKEFLVAFLRCSYQIGRSYY